MAQSMAQSVAQSMAQVGYGAVTGSATTLRHARHVRLRRVGPPYHVVRTCILAPKLSRKVPVRSNS